ncbi:hypothetical protein M408DRAFT_328429, partial [Serendipita vermifera MAFF 305830]
MSSKAQGTNKKPVAGVKPKAISKESQKKGSVAKTKAPVKELSDEESAEDNENSSESDDVDEEGMNRLMELLGDDGLDDFAKYQLGLVSAAGEDDEEDDSDAENDEENDDDDEESDEDDEEAEDGADSQEGENAEPEATMVEALEDVDLEDVSSIDDDAVPRQKLIINNSVALERIRDTIKLDSLPWTETLAVTYDETIDVDVNDDLKRELAFYKQALHGANTARALAAKHKLPFTRPADFYAEMVKSDAHMERIRQRLVDETANIKRGEEKKREREGKKFGKKVQVEKLKEREKSKKDMEERIKGLKRKRKDALDADTGFDVELEDAIAERPSKRHAGTGKGGKPTISRAKRDSKYGFGGKVGRRAKQNTKESTDSFGTDRKSKFAVGGKGKKAPMKRLGKSRRMKGGGK